MKLSIVKICIVICLLSCKGMLGIRYSINLMWINKHPPEGHSPYIIDDAGLTHRAGWMLQTVQTWAKYNPKADINFYYDYNYTRGMPLVRTLDACQDCDNIHFHDISEHKIMLRLRQAKVRLYQILDIMRVVVCKELVAKHKAEYAAVYADLDTIPSEEEQLFDSKTMQDLQRYSLVLAQCSNKQYEKLIRTGRLSKKVSKQRVLQTYIFNDAFILSNHHPEILEALELFFVQLGIKIITRNPQERAIVTLANYDATTIVGLFNFAIVAALYLRHPKEYCLCYYDAAHKKTMQLDLTKDNTELLAQGYIAHDAKLSKDLLLIPTTITTFPSDSPSLQQYSICHVFRQRALSEDWEGENDNFPIKSRSIKLFEHTQFIQFRYD